MADVKISDLTPAASANGAMQLEVNDAGSSKSVTVNQVQDQVIGTANGLIARVGANDTEARTITAGTNGGVVVSNGDGVAGNPTISNDFASQAEAEAGTVENKAMNPLRVAQAIAALGGGLDYAAMAIFSSGTVLWSSGTPVTVSKVSTGYYHFVHPWDAASVFATPASANQRTTVEADGNDAWVRVMGYNNTTAQDGIFMVLLVGASL